LVEQSWSKKLDKERKVYLHLRSKDGKQIETK